MVTMKKFMKKAGSLVTAAALTLTIFQVAGFGAASSAQPLRGAEEGLLRHINVIESSVDYNKEVTRGELAYVAARVLAAPEDSAAEVWFYDVTEENPYFGEIGALVQSGVIAGDGDGYYRPDDAATEDEVCKVFSVILGYKEVGYFDTYRKAAQRAGFTDGVNLGDGVSYGELLQVAYDVLHTEMFEPVRFGEETEYQLKDGYYAIERYHGLVPQKGVVEGCLGTTLIRPDDSITEGKIVIGGTVYNCENGDALLGQSVIFYTGRDGGDPDRNIRYIVSDDRMNHMMTISGDDVIGKTGGTVRYWSNDKERTVKVSETADVIYNGIAYPDYTEEDLKPGAGTVTLIDNNDDNLYEVIMIDAVTFGVIKTVDTENNIVFLRYPEDVTIGDGREDTEMVFRRGEYKALPSSVTSGTAVAVKESKNQAGTKYMTVYLLETGSYGAVESIGEDFIKVAGVTYATNGATVTDTSNAIRPGENVTVYLYNGICGVILHPENDMDKIGYLVNARRENKSFAGVLEVQLVDTNRTLLELKGTKKIIVDGKTCTDNDTNTVLTSLAATAAQSAKPDSAYPYAQLVRYRLNNDGYLTHLDTAAYNAADETEDSLQKHTFNETNSLTYNARNAAWFDGNNFAFTSGATALGTVWMVPENARDEADWYHAGLDEYSYKMDAYNFDKEYATVDYVVAYYTKPETPEEVDKNRWAEVITGIDTVLNDEGEQTKKVYTIAGGGTTRTHTLDPYAGADAIPADLAIGDVIRVGSNKTGSTVNLVQRFYHIGVTPSSRSFNAGNPNAQGVQDDRTYMAFGTGLYVNNGILGFTTSINDKTESCAERINFFNFKLGSASVFVYDSEKSEPKVKQSDINDLVTWEMNPATTDRVVLYAKDGYLQFVLIVK